MEAVLAGHSIELSIAFVQSVWRMSLDFFNMQPKVWVVFSGPEFDQPIAQGNQLFRQLIQFFLVAIREEIAPQEIRIDVPRGPRCAWSGGGGKANSPQELCGWNCFVTKTAEEQWGRIDLAQR
jgi:hypothetical protein